MHRTHDQDVPLTFFPSVPLINNKWQSKCPAPTLQIQPKISHDNYLIIVESRRILMQETEDKRLLFFWNSKQNNRQHVLSDVPFGLAQIEMYHQNQLVTRASDVNARLRLKIRNIEHVHYMREKNRCPSRWGKNLLDMVIAVGGFRVTSSPPCWWAKTKDLPLASFVRPPGEVVHFSIVIGVSRGWLKTSSII